MTFFSWVGCVVLRFVQRKLKPEEAFTTKKWMVLAEHLLAQAHIHNIYMCFQFLFHWFSLIILQILPLSTKWRRVARAKKKKY